MDDFALYHDLSDSQFYHSHIYIYTLGCCCSCCCCVCVCVGTGVFFARACATAEQAMCMEAHHRVCLHQNGVSQSYHSDYFARWSWRMCL